MSSTVDNQKDVNKMGYLKKQKTMKKKLFVLREESDNGPARLEYYDNEKKFVCGRPKRSIHLHNCFSINAKSDSKNKYAIVLYTREDCFSIICDNELDQKEWLSAMINLRNYHTHGTSASPLYEHLWPVTVKSKGLGSSKHLSPGHYRLCLMPKEISFVRPNKDTPDLVLQLASIRKCGHTECFFYLEPGRMAATGSGVLWMQVEDTVIAQNMHEAILNFMTASSLSADQPTFRPRRHTVTDKSKPTNLPVKPHSGTSQSSSAMPVTRSKTMSSVDPPTRWRVSQSPSKSISGLSTPHPLTTADLSSFTQNLSLSSDVVPRSRMDSTFSRNTNSFSADELDSPTQEHDIGSLTPTRCSDSYVEVDHHLLDFGLSPVVGRQTSSHQTADESLDSMGVSSKSDAYMEMEMTKNVTSAEKMSAPPRRPSHLSESQSVDGSQYMDMALAFVKEDANPAGDEGPTDCSRTMARDVTTSGSLTASQDQSEVDGYILMNTGMGPLEESSYIDMSQKSSITASPALSSGSSLHDVPLDTHYLPMSGGSRSNSLSEQDEYFEVSPDSTGYNTMTHVGSSPRLSQTLRPDRVCSYLADENSEQIPLRSSSFGSRSQLIQSKSLTESYLDMKKHPKSPGDGDRAASTPMLSRAASQKGKKNVSATARRLSKETLEEKDFLMEMNFNPRVRHGKEHDYEEVRPRSSSGGSYDFRGRTLSLGSQDRRRTGSFGYREKLSKIASMARANVKESEQMESSHSRRQRIASICQDSFHKRTSSFGAAIADMRPRSSSHGNARYVDMTGCMHKSSNHASSHDSLHRLNKRSSQESVTLGTGEYLDMRPRVSTLPSQVLVSMYKNTDYLHCTRRSPLLTDSDYLSMEPGKSSGESSAEYTSMELHPQKTSEGHPQRMRSRAKRGSTSSKVSFSSSESLASNTSQSSDGRGIDKQRALGPSITPEGVGQGSTSSRASRSSERSRSKAASLDDSYMLYSPVNSRESSPLPGNCGASLDKVSSPIRGTDKSLEPLGACSGLPSRTEKKHDYVNVDYDAGKDVNREAAVLEQPSSSGERLPSLAFSGWQSSGSSSVSSPGPERRSFRCEGPSIPCPKAPCSSAASQMTKRNHLASQQQVHGSKDGLASSGIHDDGINQQQDVSGASATSRSPKPGSDRVDKDVRGVRKFAEEQLKARSSHDDVQQSESAQYSAADECNYTEINPGASCPGKPTMPVPFPSLEPVVSPIRDDSSHDQCQRVNMPTPLSSTDGDYIEIHEARNSHVIREQSTSSEADTVHVGLASSGVTTDSHPSHGSVEAIPSSKPEVNYATLDLQAAADEVTAKGGARPKHTSGGSSGDSDSFDEMPLQYAQIDFIKSEQLSRNSAEKKTRAPFDI